MKNLAPLILVLACGCLFSPDKMVFVTASALLVFIVRYSWRQNEPKIVFLGMIFYWLTVCSLLVYGAIFNIPLVELTAVPETFVYTTYLAMAATFCYCSGMLLAMKNTKAVSIDVIFGELKKYNGRKLLIFYSVYSLFASSLAGVVLSFGGLSQVGVAVIWFKWAFFTLMIIHTLIFKQNQKYVNIILLVEVVLSFSGFWSSFKDYLFIAAACFLSFSAVLTARRVLLVGFLGLATFFLMVMWTVVKGEYRQFLTGGQKTQVVHQESKVGNLQKLFSLVNDQFSPENFNANFSRGVKDLVNRVNYTEYFSMAVRQVPDIMPYEGGALLAGGFEHVFKPRLFFPNKQSIDDSKITSKYTGRGFSGADEGTSFSLGQVAERYIDYGPVYMFIPIFFFGMLIGLIFKYIISKSLNTVWGLSFVAPLVFIIPSLGIATTKFLGWTLTYFIVWYFFNKYLVIRLDKYFKDIK